MRHLYHPVPFCRTGSFYARMHCAFLLLVRCHPAGCGFVRIRVRLLTYHRFTGLPPRTAARFTCSRTICLRLCRHRLPRYAPAATPTAHCSVLLPHHFGFYPRSVLRFLSPNYLLCVRLVLLHHTQPTLPDSAAFVSLHSTCHTTCLRMVLHCIRRHYHTTRYHVTVTMPHALPYVPCAGFSCSLVLPAVFWVLATHWCGSCRSRACLVRSSTTLPYFPAVGRRSLHLHC